jgi:cation diffusion facilitator CzcD-associated flavoprotein CzcO
MNWALEHLLAALTLLIHWDLPPSPHPTSSKTIAVIGGGTGGLGALQVLLDVKRKNNLNWEVVLYEQRQEVGGVW